ncbi:MAG: methyltransferase domain-containing protein [Candidatus Hodarchaeota archaeon]
MLKSTKINIGCGMAYRSGYLNLDSNQHSGVDLVASAEFLPLRNEIVDYIESYQVIEHFGQVTAEKVLMEWWRILRPGESLAIETVDIQGSINLVRAKNSQKIMRWLYGVEEPGMIHNRSYTFLELTDLLKKVGFTSLKRKRPQGVWQTGAMRLECAKSDNTAHYRVLNGIRNRIIDFCERHQSIYWDIQNALGQHLVESFEPQELILDVFVISPVLGSWIVDELAEKSILTASERDKWLQVANFLKSINFPGILANILMEFSRRPKEQIEAFISVRKLAKESIRAVCHNEKRTIEKIKTQPSQNDIKLFLPWEIEQRSLGYATEGIRLVAHGKVKLAVKSFVKSSKLNSDNLLAYWNLGRLHRILGNLERSEQAYKLACTLSNRKDLQEEIRSSKIVQYAVELQDVYSQ